MGPIEANEFTTETLASAGLLVAVSLIVDIAEILGTAAQ